MVEMNSISVEPTKRQIVANKHGYYIKGFPVTPEEDYWITLCLIEKVKDGENPLHNLKKLCRRADISIPNTEIAKFLAEHADFFGKWIYQKNFKIPPIIDSYKPPYIIIPPYNKWQMVMEEIHLTKDEERTVKIRPGTNRLRQGTYWEITPRVDTKKECWIDTKTWKIYLRYWTEIQKPGCFIQLKPEYNEYDEDRLGHNWEHLSYTRHIKRYIKYPKDLDKYIHLSQDDCDFSAGTPFADGTYSDENPLRVTTTVWYQDEETGKICRPDNFIYNILENIGEIQHEVTLIEDTRVEDLPTEDTDPAFTPIGERYKNDWDEYYEWIRENKEN